MDWSRPPPIAHAESLAQCDIFTFGNTFWNFSTAASVTWVFSTLRI
jgi:hypothetical protein